MKTKKYEQNLSKRNQHNDNIDTFMQYTGIVFKKTTGSYTVKVDHKMIPCKLAARLQKQAGKVSGKQGTRRERKGSVPANLSPEMIVVGDRVRLADGADGTGVILEVLPRRNQLSRRSPVPMPTARASEQVIASNVDRMVPVFAAANPTPKWNLLDRYLALAEALELPVVIAITKLDLAKEPDGSINEELMAAVSEYRRLGYPVVLTSALTGHGLEELKQNLQDGLSVFLGKSGVGKSALLNGLQPGLGLRVNEVSRATGKGKHTTTHMEIFPLDDGGAVIDTPGVREFGLWDMDGEELAYFYREMQSLVGGCRFGLDCRHDEEPGCAIRRAVAEGKISPRRYQSYLHLKEELGAP